jgi:hypothetical protein
VGLCMIGGALMMQSGNSAHAGSTPAAAVAVAAVTHAQAMPTVVWYGSSTPRQEGIPCGGGPTFNDVFEIHTIYRAWSDGRVEMRTARCKVYDLGAVGNECPITDLRCSGNAPSCISPWITISDPNSGYRAAADVNADELVDGIDLASILSNWGDAPRVPFPPSDCPLNLINP